MAKQQIVDIVSHDLRNPLASVQLYASLLFKNLKDPAKEVNEAEFLRGILRSTERMKRITSDLLDASKIEMAQFSINPMNESLDSIIDETLDSFRTAAEEHQIRFEVESIVPAFRVTADRSRLIQALANMVHNAIKVSPEGGSIRITAKKENETLRIAVSDQGQGISPEKMPYIFDRYWTEKNRRAQGTGLGLFIARGIARSHGGDLVARNNSEGGATFALTIPLDKRKIALVA